MTDQLSLMFVVPPPAVEESEPFNPFDHLNPQTFLALSQHALANGLALTLSSGDYASAARGRIPFCAPRKASLLINGNRETALWAQMPIEHASAVHGLLLSYAEQISVAVYEPDSEAYQLEGSAYQGSDFPALVDTAHNLGIDINHLAYLGAFLVNGHCYELPPDSAMHEIVSPYLGSGMPAGSCPDDPQTCPGTIMPMPTLM